MLLYNYIAGTNSYVLFGGFWTTKKTLLSRQRRTFSWRQSSVVVGISAVHSQCLSVCLFGENCKG